MAPVPGVPGLACHPSPAPSFLDGCWLHPQGCLWPRQSGYSGPSSPGPERTAHRCRPSRRGWNQALHLFSRYLLSIDCVPGPAGGSADTALNRRGNSPCSYGALILALTSPGHLEMGQTAQAGAFCLAGTWSCVIDTHCSQCRPGSCLIAHTKQEEQNTAGRAE